MDNQSLPPLTREEAYAYHPAVWTPADAVQTANDFHAHLDHSERGVDQRWWMSQHRERRARVEDFLSVMMLLLTAAFLGFCLMVLLSTPAHADEGAVKAWEWEYGPAACSFLDEHHTVTAFSGLMYAAEQMGLTPVEAGEAVTTVVLDQCPIHRPLVRAFVVKYGAPA